MCNRCTFLTFHHLIPRKVHRRAHYKKHYLKHELQQGIEICRTCHSGIHKRYSEMELAKRLNTESLLKNDSTLKVFFNWVSRQKISL